MVSSPSLLHTSVPVSETHVSVKLFPAQRFTTLVLGEKNTEEVNGIMLKQKLVNSNLQLIRIVERPRYCSVSVSKIIFSLCLILNQCTHSHTKLMLQVIIVLHVHVQRSMELCKRLIHTRHV